MPVGIEIQSLRAVELDRQEPAVGLEAVVELGAVRRIPRVSDFLADAFRNRRCRLGARRRRPDGTLRKRRFGRNHILKSIKHFRFR